MSGRTLARVVAWGSLLLLSALPPLLYFAAAISADAMKLALLAGTLAWFAAAPFAMRGEEPAGS